MGIWHLILILFYPLIVLCVLKEFNRETEQKKDEKDEQGRDFYRIKELESQVKLLQRELNEFRPPEAGKNEKEV